MDPQNAIEVRNVRKEFRIGGSTSLKDMLTYMERKKIRRTVLQDITFDVKKGTTLGIIGRNGSGKSTMLKLLTRILVPNDGTIELDGKVACLIELGAGFHPDMTGRENVYTNASIFGLSKDQVDERYDRIVEFSEIGDYIDERVRNYSSGMYMRLAFSVAINVDADILLVDEILSVGDLRFQNKCFDKFMELKNSGKSIVLVTHGVDTARRVCDKVLWLSDGRIRMYGDPKDVCDAYEKEMTSGNGQ